MRAEESLAALLPTRRVAVLLGGASAEREVSLRSGAGVIAALRKRGWEAVAFDPAEQPLPRLKELEVGVAFVALHGGAGENGTVQGCLEMLNIPYTGSGVLASAVCMHKPAAQTILGAAGLPIPPWLYIEPGDPVDEALEKALETVGLPAVTKPPAEGSSVGVSIVRESAELREKVADLLTRYRGALIEKYVPFMEIAVGILGYDNTLRALPVLELIPQKEFYDYEAKYTKGMTEFRIPPNLPEDVWKHAQEVALDAHRILGCHGLSRVDIMVDEELRPLVHDVNTVPGLTETSDIPAEAEAAGISYDDLVIEILASAVPRLSGERR